MEELTGGNNYPRIRFGIGRDYPQGKQSDYVLGKWTDEQMKQLPELIENASEALISIMQEGLSRAMNKFNTRKNK